MSSVFSIESVFFTFFGYSVSYLEFVGTVLYLSSVVLIARRHWLTWPVGIVSVLLFMALFYQIQLYSAGLEQLYYLAACLYGWWFWSRTAAGDAEPARVAWGSARGMTRWVLVTLAGSLLLGWGMSHLHVWLPGLFPQAADFPYLDALTTVMSFVAMWLLVRKHIESWLYWIVVDLIGIGLYLIKGVVFLSLLYVVLLCIALWGFWGWTRSAKAAPDDALVAANL
ncbi:hypothetical protein CAI21_10130 [Alkalilimnicola ehrlichii]|uniref:Nicotinamide riboside transporter PnuC n=1 Tax=Alkalilimnicola ehrlichii TaxID=351052 RepID=A0A3E0WIY8_9GAMM|nr:nicotinamide riboside transporter PnuC [Alkalilimnicola ehrlichii]RFA29408.1 hypothetical protein CAI21_10130 [Alkalilimnicola ehrlichii]RFA31926.1 hypothetical protein CAL65_20975 [Alkalilimnicola ehrlichii]